MTSSLKYRRDIDNIINYESFNYSLIHSKLHNMFVQLSKKLFLRTSSFCFKPLPSYVLKRPQLDPNLIVKKFTELLVHFRPFLPLAPLELCHLGRKMGTKKCPKFSKIKISYSNTRYKFNFWYNLTQKYDIFVYKRRK